jgi:hypothetical protein
MFILFKMFSLKCFLISVFIWLTLVAQSQLIWMGSDTSNHDLTFSSNHRNDQALIVNNTFQNNDILDDDDSINSPIKVFNSKTLVIDCNLGHVNFLNDKNSMRHLLQLTTKKIIFPFHCFT